MKKKFLQIVSMVLIIAMVLPTTAFAADVSLKVDETTKLKVSFTATQNATIKWSSSDTAVATVTSDSDNRNATVTGIAAGTATIKAERIQYSSVTNTETFNVVVTADPVPGENETPMVPVDPEEPETPDEKDDFEITCDDDLTVYTDGGKTIQLKVEGYDDVMWDSDDDSVASVSSSGVVTGHTAGKSVTIYAYSKDKNASCTVRVVKREVEEISVSGTPKKEYTEGESFSMGSASVVAHYNDGTSETVTGYTVKPSGILAQEDTSVTITYAGKTCEVTDIKVTADSVTGIEIVSPANGSKYTVGDTIKRSDVSIKVTRSGGDKYTISAADYSEITFSPSGALTKADKKLTVAYGGKSDEILITVADTAKTLSGLKVTASATSKTEYYVGESFSSAGYTFTAEYSDGTTKNVTTNLTKSPATFDTAGNSIPVTITYKENGVSKSDIVYVKVIANSNATEIDNSEDEYELYDKEDIKIEIGDKLNDDIKWYDVFKEVRVKIDGKWKTIEDDRDLEDYPGVELVLKVYNKSDEEIKASHLNNDGEVYLQLCIKNGSSDPITSTSKSIRVYVPVTEPECTVSIYSSKTSTSASSLKATKTFSDFEDALDALMDENELEDVFDVNLGTNYAIRIKFGENQVLGGSYEFEPDYENPIFIDLNGYELKLPSDWINYDDCEDLVVTITNNNDDEDGSLIYRDKSVTLTVTEGTELKFTEGNIPMDTDAACTVTIYKNSNSTSSTSLIKTKVYDTLKEALESLEDLDEALETYNIDEDYEDTFVVRMKLGEDQNLTTFKFAPDYDTTVYIDLNGYTLKLKSEWIDYEDCEDLVVKVNNTNKEKKAALTYTDLSNTSLSLASTDSALTFEEDKIPGIYKVEVVPVTNGKVTVNPNKDTVAHGGTVTFTITPNEGYEISSVKDGTKTISAAASGYTVSSKGVGSYKKENITADVKLTVTFKKGTASSSTSSAANWTNPFTDISKSAQYYNAVAFVCSEGLFNGMTATKFEPTTTMTRAMFVTVLGRLAGVDVAKFSGTSFTDVSRSDQQISWAAPYIEWAVQNGITNGTGNGKFSPNDPITHQQMYLFMYRYAMFIENYNTPLTNASLSGIRDADEIADWAVEGVKFASQNSILITTGGKLTPTENALRCELAMLLHGFCTKVLDKNG